MTDDQKQMLQKLHAKLVVPPHGVDHQQVATILGRAAKVSEEYGELMDEVMASLGLQRADKLARYDRENLEKEYADVAISLHLLGLALGLDIDAVVAARLRAKYHEHIQE